MHKIRFPAYPLDDSNWIITDGVVFYRGLVLDERNMPGKTLGTRRLQCVRKDLFPLKRAVTDTTGILQSRRKNFITCTGKLFTYEKTLTVPLKSYKIKDVDLKGEASLLWLHGVNTPMTIPRPPDPNYKWARVLELNSAPWLLYDYTKERQKLTHRKV